MAYNTTYVLKQGEKDTVMSFTLRDEHGPVNLNGWTVTVSARQGADEPAIDEAPCVLSPDQLTTGKGKGSFIFDEETSNIPTGTYRLEFKGTTAGGAVFFFPKAKGAAYATLVVQKPLS